MGGYILKAATQSPCKSNTKALCPPQPKQSTLKKYLEGQGNIIFFTICGLQN